MSYVKFYNLVADSNSMCYVLKFQKKSKEVNSKRSRWWVLSLNFLWPRVITEHWTLNHWGNTGGTLEWYYCGGSECITSVLVTVLNLFKIHFLVGLNNFLVEGLIWGNWIETTVQGSAIRCIGDKGNTVGEVGPSIDLDHTLLFWYCLQKRMNLTCIVRQWSLWGEPVDHYSSNTACALNTEQFSQ